LKSVDGTGSKFRQFFKEFRKKLTTAAIHSQIAGIFGANGALGITQAAVAAASVARFDGRVQSQ
jgi:hypothetical protein